MPLLGIEANNSLPDVAPMASISFESIIETGNAPVIVAPLIIEPTMLIISTSSSFTFLVAVRLRIAVSSSSFWLFCSATVGNAVMPKIDIKHKVILFN